MWKLDNKYQLSDHKILLHLWRVYLELQLAVSLYTAIHSFFKARYAAFYYFIHSPQSFSKNSFLQSVRVKYVYSTLDYNLASEFSSHVNDLSSLILKPQD